jgi:hypothetical protein
MTANAWTTILSLVAAGAVIAAAIVGLRGSRPLPPHDKMTWDGESPYEVAFARARKRDLRVAAALTILATLCSLAAAVMPYLP